MAQPEEEPKVMGRMRHVSVADAREAPEEDESLALYKKSLGLGAGSDFVHDNAVPGRLIVTEIFLQQLRSETDQRPTIRKIAKMGVSDNSFEIERKVVYKLGCKFICQRDMITQMSCQMKVKKMGISVQTQDIIMGSYVPNSTDPEKTWVSQEIAQIPDAYVAQGSMVGQLKFVSKTVSEGENENGVLFKTNFNFKVIGKDKDKEYKQFLLENPEETN